ELGFTTVLVTPQAGVFRGQSALINLHDDKHTKALVLAPRAAQHVAHEFERGPAWSYPNSLMGAIALIRQTLYDARWQAAAPDPQTAGDLERREANASLEALAPLLARRQPLIYAAVDELDFQRIAAVRDEFKLRVVAFGNGYEYRRAAQLRADALPVIVPLAFPKPPEVENPDHALDTPLQALQHWEQAPSNPALLERAGVEFAVTAFGLEKAQKDFWPRVREAVLRGWSPQQALASLTTIPARLIGEQTRLGALERGRIANVVVASGDLFTNEDAVVELLFVDGVPFTTKAYDRFDPRGTWSVTSAGQTSSWQIGGTAAKPTLSIEGAECDLNVERRQVVVHLPCGKSASGATVTIVAEGRQATLRGTSQKTDDPLQPWAATRTARFEPRPPKPISERPPAPGAEYPAGAFGIAAPPRPSALLVRNATVWTSAAAGRIEQADLLVRAGKIAAVGRNVQAPADTMVIDATGKHVTPGIVDPHSHMAMAYGFNEFSSSITAETRVGDIIDPTDIALYRALAGGATTANILHGSANTIGGQAQVIKLRWGSDAAGLKFEGAMPGIKFALGENVKGSNFGDGKRYPQTRSGVEQIMRDAFAAARAYQRKAEQFRKDPKSAAPRRDLQLDALLEVLEGKRVVHIHSYRADEILMFARLAAEFGIKVGAFHHALEAYKVAEAVAGIGAGVASFSDWWAFKMEAYDAIPTNGAILHRNGVLTSFKSDSDEVVRRLNI
ncbi:MAG TPA: hypothetical protein VFR86_26735, partial [Burkholderiaceae bacterium]|nr:hypothetical protein [Burkholderiaceae bacterium]